MAPRLPLRLLRLAATGMRLGMRGVGRSLPEQRERVNAAARVLPMPHGVQVEPLHIDGTYAEWLIPEQVDEGAALLYLHGGGYVICSPDTHRPTAARIALAAGARVLLLDYRLAPENPFPAALDDSVRAWEWIGAQGYDPGRTAIAGDSAGGGLTLAAALRLRDEGRPLPAALTTLSAWTDLTFSGESASSKDAIDPMLGGFQDGIRTMQDWYAPGRDLRDPYISPFFGDPRGLPPLLMQVGSDEILLDDSTRVYEKARQAGVDAYLEIWPNMWHVFQAFAPLVHDSAKAIEHIGAFLRHHLSVKEEIK